MTERELRQLGRGDLLQMLLEQGRENEKLKQENEALQKKLDDRTLRIDKAGSIAEAALAIKGVFEAAEASCLQYIENINRLNKEQTEINRQREAESTAEAERLIKEATDRSTALEAKAAAEADRLVREATERSSAMEAKAAAEARRLTDETRDRCIMMEAETNVKCQAQIRDAEKTVEERWAQISQRLTALYQSHQGLMELVTHGVSLVPERGGSVAEETDEKAAGTTHTW